MAIEIERKFLLKSSDWREGIQWSDTIIQAYISDSRSHITRVRLTNDRTGYITIKSKNTGISRTELEHGISTQLAKDLIEHSALRSLSKIRHLVVCNGQRFEIDEFLDLNKGLVVAELELESEDQSIIMPTWLGKDVSSIQRYYNDDLAKYPFALWSDFEKRYHEEL